MYNNLLSFIIMSALFSIAGIPPFVGLVIKIIYYFYTYKNKNMK